MPKKDADPFSCFQLASGRWRAVAQTRDAAGKLKPTAKERQTEKEARQAMRDHLRTTGRLAPSASMTVAAMLDAFLVRCEAKGRAPNTLRKYRRYARLVSEQIGHHPIDKLMPSHVEAMMDSFAGAPDANCARSCLRAAINKVARKGAPSLPNVAELADPREHRAKRPTKLTEKGMEDVLAAEVDDALRVLWLLLGSTGIRPVEARTLLWAELEDWEDGMWLRKATAKTEEGKRPIPVPKPVAAEIRKLRKSGLFVFPSPFTGKPYNETSVQDRWKVAVAAAGLAEDITLYQLRHLFGTIKARKVPDHVLKRLMRHRDIRTTKTYYVDEFDDELRKVADEA